MTIRVESDSASSGRESLSRDRMAISLEAESPSNLRKKLRKNLPTLASGLTSLLLHLIVLVVLAFCLFSNQENHPGRITAELVEAPEELLAPADDRQLTVEIDVLPDSKSELNAEAMDNSLANEVPVPIASVTMEEDDSAAESASESRVPTAPDQPLPSGGGLDGRTAASRSALASRFGGTAASELAVENGLKWLADHQHPDGGWRLDFSTGSCDGRCGDPASSESTTAATGLVIMAFLGAGYTHQSGPWQTQVKNGLDYLKGRMRITFFGGNLAEGTMYAQGIATIALSEAYAMTHDPDLLDPTRSAMEYIVTAQHSAGGWRYVPGEPGDITVTGWQLMALKSCQLAGFEVPPETLIKANRFLSLVGDDSTGLFRYQVQDRDHDPTSTAIGLLMQMYRGWSPEHRGLLAGTDDLVKIGLSENNIYYNYYATQALFHARHEQWDSWNQRMRDYLVATQSQTDHETGSWFFRERYGSVGGRLYTTAMAVMILEVYYRYLPLFDRDSWSE